MIPLPAQNPFNETTQYTAHRAYIKAHDLETRYAQVEMPPDAKLEVLVVARLLGHMLLEAPTEQGRENFALEVVRCETDLELQNLAERYKNHFLRIFYSPRLRNLTPNSYPSDSGPPYDMNKVDCIQGLLASPKSHAKSKALALKRDGYRSVLAGNIDTASWQAGLVQVGENDLISLTHAAHILDRPTHEDLSVDDKTPYAMSAAAILNRFGQINVLHELGGPEIHRLSNVITLDMGLQSWFSHLYIWFERNNNDPPNTYRPASRDSIFLRGMPLTVTFSTPDAALLPLPDPRYLRVHAACAKIAHLSGIGKHIFKVLRDLEGTDVLPSEGGSNVLYHALIFHADIEV